MSDPAAIRAKLDAAAKALPDAINPNDFNGVDANGGSVLNTVIGVVEGGNQRRADPQGGKRHGNTHNGAASGGKRATV